MKAYTYNDIFLYSKIEEILTKEENKILYEYCTKFGEKYKNEIEDMSYFILEQDLTKHGFEYCKNNYLIRQNIDVKLSDEEHENFNAITKEIEIRLNSEDITSHYPNIETDNYHWHFNLVISSTIPLRPHTDNPIDLIEYGIKNNIPVSSGIYKGMIYIGDPNINYKDYGTRMYKSSEEDSEICEIEFIPGNACIFKPSTNTWHGTDFKNGLPNNRYCITMQYYKD